MTIDKSLQGGAYLSGTGGVASNVHDRNRGHGLPSVVSDAAYERLASRMSAQRVASAPPLIEVTAVEEPSSSTDTSMGRRFASVRDIERAGFVKVATGFYREGADKLAHAIWELRGAGEGDDAYLLVRKREERDVDLRQAAEVGGIGTAAALATGIIRTGKTAAKTATATRGFQVGQKVLAVRNGSIADAVVLMVRPEEGAIDLMFGGGQKDEHVPMDMVVEPAIDLSVGGVADVAGPMDAGVVGEADGMDMLMGAPHDHDDEFTGGGGGAIEVSADDLYPAPGGAGQSPFDVAVSPASDLQPRVMGEETAGHEHEHEHDPRSMGIMLARRAAQEAAEFAHRIAVEFGGAFYPGAKLIVKEPFKPFFHGGKIRVPAGAELIVDGFHTPDQDVWHDFEVLPDPVPDGTRTDNMRLRLRASTGGILLVTMDELRNKFDAVESPSSSESNEMPGEPVYQREDSSADPSGSTRFERTPRPRPSLAPEGVGDLSVNPYETTKVVSPERWK